MFSCYRTYVHALPEGAARLTARSSTTPLVRGRAEKEKKTGGPQRRRNFSIRFPSGALINCGQLLKRRNEGTAAAAAAAAHRRVALS